MLNKLEVVNFKCFQQQRFNFSNLTVFCGANSAGKSTAIQALLLIKQNQDKGRLVEKSLDLYGELISFGTLGDVFFHGAQENKIQVLINQELFSIKVTPGNRQSYEVALIDGSSEDFKELRNDFVYLSAERLGPRASFDIGRDLSRLNVGVLGEFALSEYQRFSDLKVQNQSFAKAIFEGGEVEGDIYTDKALKEVMEGICPGFNITVTKSEAIDKIYNTYSVESARTPVRPINVGFGISYILPIVIAAICMKPGGTLIVENPEVHLHPQAQSKLAGFLGLLSLHDVQVIVETHSDHIINGLRVFSKDNDVKSGHVLINSITDSGNKRIVKEINIDEDGNLSDLDEGFFDQMGKDLLRLF